MLCHEVMTTQIVACHEDDTVERCARLMRDQNVGFLPVEDRQGQVVGIVTDRDLVTRYLAAERPAHLPVRAIMTQSLLACRPGDELWMAEEEMAKAKKSRMLAVDDDGRAVGIISLTDVSRVEDEGRFGHLFRAVTGREVARPFPRLRFGVDWFI